MCVTMWEQRAEDPLSAHVNERMHTGNGFETMRQDEKHTSIDRFKEVAAERKTFNVRMEQYKAKQKHLWELRLAEALQEVVDDGHTKREIGEAWGSSDPYTPGKLIERYLNG